MIFYILNYTNMIYFYGNDILQIKGRRQILSY